MNLKEAIREVKSLGFCYFAETADDTENIERRIAEHVLGTSIRGIDPWTARRDALSQVLESLSDDQLNDIVKSEYGVWPHQVGGGRALLRRVRDVISEAIEQSLRKGA